jgi:hypothetical protein
VAATSRRRQNVPNLSKHRPDRHHRAVAPLDDRDRLGSTKPVIKLLAEIIKQRVHSAPT